MTLDRDDIVAGLGELAGELDAGGLELTIHVVGFVDVVKQIAIRRR